MMIQNIQTSLKNKFRQRNYLLFIVLVAMVNFIIMPRRNSPYHLLVIDSNYFKQANNSTWIPVMGAVTLAVILPFVIFNLTDNMITNDRQNGFFKLLKTNQFAIVPYVLAKFIVGVLIGWGVIITVLISNVIMALMLYQHSDFKLTCLIFLPFVGTVIFISALAVFIDSFNIKTQWLKVGGNLFITGLLAFNIINSTYRKPSFSDITGFNIFNNVIQNACVASKGNPDNHIMLLTNQLAQGKHTLIFK